MDGSDESKDAEHPDAIDEILGQWARERPDLDLSAIGVFGRIMRLSLVLGVTVERTYARYGLRGGEFDVLTALRRSGPPYTLTPSELAESLMMSRAGMTKRLDRLESVGLVERSLDPADRRSFRVALSGEGRDLIDAALTDHAANLARLSSGLTAEDGRMLERTLRTLLLTVRDGDGGGDGRDDDGQ
jgi:DNA-binding MarR family transcriptional regulator